MTSQVKEFLTKKIYKRQIIIPKKYYTIINYIPFILLIKFYFQQPFTAQMYKEAQPGSKCTNKHVYYFAALLLHGKNYSSI